MKIEILYFDGCPNHGLAVHRVREALAEQGLSANISELNVRNSSDAQELGFLGSPSIRVNGVDIDPAARFSRDYRIVCRTYPVNGRREGLPSREMVPQAIVDVCSEPSTANSDAGQETRANSTTSFRAGFFAAGSIVAAIVASFCCILPIVFALTDVSILGASALFDSWRPYLLGITFGLLGLGFYLAYRPIKSECVPGSACAMPAAKPSGRLILWIATALVILFATFPYYSGTVAKLLIR